MCHAAPGKSPAAGGVVGECGFRRLVLARVPGVGEVEAFGSQYAMRVWLNPEMLTDYSLTVADVVTALRSYNVEVSAGQFGGMPAVEGQPALSTASSP